MAFTYDSSPYYYNSSMYLARPDTQPEDYGYGSKDFHLPLMDPGLDAYLAQKDPDYVQTTYLSLDTSFDFERKLGLHQPNNVDIGSQLESTATLKKRRSTSDHNLQTSLTDQGFLTREQQSPRSSNNFRAESSQQNSNYASLKPATEPSLRSKNSFLLLEANLDGTINQQPVLSQLGRRTGKVMPIDNIVLDGEITFPDKLTPPELALKKATKIAQRDTLALEGQHDLSRPRSFNAQNTMQATAGKRVQLTRPKDSLVLHGQFDMQKREMSSVFDLPEGRVQKIKPKNTLELEGILDMTQTHKINKSPSSTPIRRPAKVIPKNNLSPEGEMQFSQTDSINRQDVSRAVSSSRTTKIAPTDTLSLFGDSLFDRSDNINFQSPVIAERGAKVIPKDSLGLFGEMELLRKTNSEEYQPGSKVEKQTPKSTLRLSGKAKFKTSSRCDYLVPKNVQRSSVNTPLHEGSLKPEGQLIMDRKHRDTYRSVSAKSLTSLRERKNIRADNLALPQSAKMVKSSTSQEDFKIWEATSVSKASPSRVRSISALQLDLLEQPEMSHYTSMSNSDFSWSTPNSPRVKMTSPRDSLQLSKAPMVARKSYEDDYSGLLHSQVTAVPSHTAHVDKLRINGGSMSSRSVAQQDYSHNVSAKNNKPDWYTSPIRQAYNSIIT